jgi:hypothetical protein
VFATGSPSSSGELHFIHTLSWRQHSYLAPFEYIFQNFTTWRRLAQTRRAAMDVIIPPTFAALSVYDWGALWRGVRATPLLPDGRRA